MKAISLKTAGPFLLLTFIYFIVGFLTTVNGQCQGPLKVAFLSDASLMRNSLTTLISFSFFLGYLLNSSRTGKMLNSNLNDNVNGNGNGNVDLNLNDNVNVNDNLNEK